MSLIHFEAHRRFARIVGRRVVLLSYISGHGLKPHRVMSFKRSNDPRFAEKLEDAVPLYLHPPPGAVVIPVDEKCQIQAWDRTQPGLPWKKGRCGTMTHDYKRHGTATLFAGMNLADGSIISTFMPTHTHQDWIRFLKLIHGRPQPVGYTPIVPSVELG